MSVTADTMNTAKKRPTGTRFGIRLQLMAAFAVIVLLALGNGGNALVSFESVRAALTSITQQDAVGLSSARELESGAARIVAIAPSLTSARSEVEVESVNERIKALFAALESTTARGTATGMPAETIDRVREIESRLSANLKDLERSVSQRLALEAKLHELATAAVSDHSLFNARIAPSLSTSEKRFKEAATTVNSAIAAFQKVAESSRTSLAAAYDTRARATDAITAARLLTKAQTVDDVDKANEQFMGIAISLANSIRNLRSDQRFDAIAKEIGIVVKLAADEGDVFRQRRQALAAGTLSEEDNANLEARLTEAETATKRLLSAATTFLTRDRTDYIISARTVQDDIESAMTNLIDKDFVVYRDLLRLSATGNLIGDLLNQSASALTTSQLDDIEKVFAETSRSFLETLANHASDNGPANDSAKALIARGTGNEGLFATRRAVLAAAKEESRLLSANTQAAAELAQITATLVQSAETAMAESSDDADATMSSSRISIILVSVAILVISLIIVQVVVQRRIARRLVALDEAMRAIAEGDLDHAIPANGNDEIAEMARALVVFRDNAREIEAANQRAAEERARAAERRRADLLELANELETGVASAAKALTDNAGAMRNEADDMSNVAERARGEAMDASGTADQTRSNVQAVAAAAQELAASIAEISRQVTDSARLAGQATTEADQTDETMRSLQAAASEIGQVVELINAIAGQTNLLALNATIEAARAGEAGKGFAVVAGEVKSLASQTAQATDQISQKIAAIQTVTDRAVDAIHHIVGTIGTISSISNSIAAAVEEQDASTREIARNVEQAARGAEALYQTLSVVVDGADRTRGGAGRVQSSSSMMASGIQSLRSDIEQVVEKIRAG